MRTLAIVLLILGAVGVFVGFGGVTINGSPPFGLSRTLYFVAALILVIVGAVTLLVARQRPQSK